MMSENIMQMKILTWTGNEEVILIAESSLALQIVWDSLKWLRDVYRKRGANYLQIRTFYK